MHSRTVFFVSDGTGITAETFGNAILAQFELVPRRVRLPFVDTVDKAHQAVRQINHTAELEGKKPVVFTTLVNMEVLKVIQEGCKGMLLDMFGTFVHPLEEELGIKSHHRVGRFSDVSRSKEYTDRIEAINFSLAHDDGQSHRDLAGADVILVGVSRSGKTPTSLYLAMQHGLKAANYPLIPEDFDRRQLPPALSAGEICHVLAPRQMGKSSLRVRTMRGLVEQGRLCVSIDLSVIGSRQSSAEQWYAGICRSLLAL